MIPHDAGLPDPSSNLPPPRDTIPMVSRIDGPHPIPSHAMPAAAPPPGLSAAPDLAALLHGVRRRWISAVLLGGLLSAATACGVWYLLTPKFTAMAKLRVLSDDPRVMSDRDRFGSSGEFRTVMQTVAQQIMSRPVIQKALKRQEVRELALETREHDPVTFVEEDLKVVAAEGSELLNISMSSFDPMVSVKVANAVKAIYLDEIYYKEKQARNDRLRELEAAYDAQKDTLARKKTHLNKLAKALGTIDPLVLAQRRMELSQVLRDTKGQQVQNSVKLYEAKAALEVLDLKAKMAQEMANPGKPGSGVSPITFADIEAALDSDGEARAHRERMAKLQVLVEDYMNKGGADHPTAASAQNRISSLRKLIDKRRVVVAERLKKAAADKATAALQMTTGPQGENTSIARGQLEKAIKHLTDLQATLQHDIGELAAQLERPQVLGPDLEVQVEEARCLEKVVADLGTKVEYERVESRAAPRITSFQDAEVMKKDSKKQLLATIAAPFVVFGGVCGGLALLDVRQRRIRSAGQLSRGLGIRVVGAVPEMAGLEKQVVSPVGENDLEGTLVLESIDAIRTQVLHEADGNSARLVMVTSAAAGEGKTTLASHLASSLARAGRKTLLVDGDLRRPALHQLFELPQQPGFSEVLLGEVEVTEAWQDTTTDNLTVMTAGQWDREVLLALSRGGLEAVFDKLLEEFDFVIIDSHPVLAATDSLLLGRQVDAVILSVLREVSQMPKVYAASQKMQTLGIPVLGAVVNGSDPEEVFTNTTNNLAAVA